MAQARSNPYEPVPSPEMGVIGWSIAAAVALLLLPLLSFVLLARVVMRWTAAEPRDRSRRRPGI